jgi:Uncharacterised nucleotidyltransferase
MVRRRSRDQRVKSTSVALPSLTKVAAALRKTTESLARELAVPTHEPPLWTEFEWHIARAVAGMQGVSSLLYDGLRWEGPESWRWFLHEQRKQSDARHLRIASLLNAIDSQARFEGVALVGLKGAALLASGIYTTGQRPMGDIDLLIRNDDAKAVSRVLVACDYAAAFSTHRHQVFQPRVRKLSTRVRLGEHVDNAVKIEVHTRIAEPLPVMAMDITQFLFPRVAHAGLNAYPSNASLMLHLLLHAAGNIRARALRLIQLHDIALLAGRFGPGDWEALLAMRPDGGALWWALPPLILTARYYPATIPQDLLASLRIGCPWLLGKLARRQRLADVSWSNIRIAAFPGVEWSRTPREAIEFMRSRIWPSREALLELKEGADQIPDSSTVPWYGISHGARILRWVLSRPPRVQTLLSVRAALADGS